METIRLPNQFYLAQDLSLCLLAAQLLGSADYKLKLHSARLKASMLLFRRLCEKREVIPFLNLIQEISDLFGLPTQKPLFSCKVWEDNESCIKTAKSPKFTPRTKHITIKYHHFRRFVDDARVDIWSIGKTEQIADIFTKPLGEKAFCYLCRKLMGW